jgi:hypothetical protein
MSTAISFKKEQTYRLHDKKREDYNGKNKQSSRSTDKTDMKKNHSSGCALPQAKSRSRIFSIRPVRLAYQTPASSTFLSQQISHQQPASSTLLSEQTSTSHQPPANRTGCKARIRGA